MKFCLLLLLLYFLFLNFVFLCLEVLLFGGIFGDKLEKIVKEVLDLNFLWFCLFCVLFCLFIRYVGRINFSVKIFILFNKFLLSERLLFFDIIGDGCVLIELLILLYY